MANKRARVLFALMLCLFAAPVVRAQGPVPSIARDVAFEQKLDAQVPLDVTARDEDGRATQLATLLRGKPIVLTLNYLHCKNLCPIVLDSLVGVLADLPFSIGKDFDVVTLSIDPRELPALAAAKKKQYLKSYAREGATDGWHFLTAERDEIQRVTDAVGFHFAYDARQDEFAHPAGVIVLTPEGRVSRYLYGTEISAQDMRLALVEASQHRIGSPVDELLLVCYHYDPTLGKY
ncbi:MAG: SCO family protein, partial [Chloroflexi bacterium]|nr:SCO family protein [Chloroflexota bacterium]